MNNKSIILIAIVIVIVAIVGFVSYNPFASADNQVKVGAATFTMPEGFHVGTDYNNETNITNGYDTVLLEDCGNDNISKYIKQYIKFKKSKDNTTKVKTQNFTVDDTVVYKVYPVNHTSTVHYWFKHDGEVYHMHNPNVGENFEKIVIDLIRSVK